MKNKIRCLFDDLADKLNNIDVEHYLVFFGALMMIFLIAAMILAPMSASAADEEATMILKAGTYRLKDILPLLNWTDGSYFEDYVYFDFECNVIGGTSQCNAIQIQQEDINADNVCISLYYETSDGSLNVYNGSATNGEWSTISSDGVIVGKTIHIITDQTITTEYDEDDVEYANAIKTAFMSWFREATDYNEVNCGTPPQCPTLEEQIADYSGSWVQFMNTVRQNNPALGNSYQNVVDEAIVAGKISIQGDFIHFSGTYDELLQLLMTMSNNNPNIQYALEQELQRQFENGVAGGYDDGYSDGKDYGQEIGYKEGQMDGYNLAASESFGENLIGDLLNAPMNALNKWVLYTAPNGTVVTMGGVFGALIALTIFVIFLRMFAGG